MFQYRIALAQMRRGASEQEIARSHCMGRHKLADLRVLAEQHGWLDTQTPLPEDAQIAAALGAPRLPASTVSTLEPHRERIAAWLDQGVQGTTILGALLRNHGHLPPAARQFFAHDRAWCLQQARGVGAACAELIERLLADRILERLRAAQGVLRRRDRFGAARLEAACARALLHSSPYYRTVKTILTGGFDQLPLDGADGVHTLD